MLSERNWSGEGVLRMVLGLFGTVCIVSLVGSLFRYGFGSGGTEQQTASMAETLFRVFASQGIALAWVIYFLRDQRLNLSSAFGLFQRIPRAVVYGVLVGIFVVPIVWLLQFVSVQVLQSLRLGPEAQELVTTFRETTKAADQGLTPNKILFGISVIFLAPIVEELLFRGIFYPTLRNLGRGRSPVAVDAAASDPFTQNPPTAPAQPKKTMGRFFATLVTALLFAFMHNNLAGMIPLMFLGVVLVLVYEETDNLLAPILVHSIFNGANFVMMLFEAKLNQILLPT